MIRPIFPILLTIVEIMEDYEIFRFFYPDCLRQVQLAGYNLVKRIVSLIIPQCSLETSSGIEIGSHRDFLGLNVPA